MIKDQINQANIAMAAAMTKAAGTSHNQDSKGKGKREKKENAQTVNRPDMEKRIALRKAEAKLTTPQTGGKRKWKKQNIKPQM